MNCSPNYIVKFLLKLQIVLQANSEWVEISQQNYRKPLRTVSKLAAQHYFETSTRKANRIYMNNSLPETNWKNGFVSAFPSEVRRVFTTVTDSPYTAISEKPDTNTKTNPPENKNKNAFNNPAAEGYKVSAFNTTIEKHEDNFNNTSESSFSENDQNISVDLSSENAETSPTFEVKPKETPSADNKANAIENVIKLVKIVADTITRNTHRSVNSKMKYLRELKNTILKDIETRIETVWPDDAQPSRRVRRSQRGSHVEFPSSESALMTISFLTFAVFLVKLVLSSVLSYLLSETHIATEKCTVLSNRAGGRIGPFVRTMPTPPPEKVTIGPTKLPLAAQCCIRSAILHYNFETQLIQTYKNKAMVVNPVIATVGRALNLPNNY